MASIRSNVIAINTAILGIILISFGIVLYYRIGISSLSRLDARLGQQAEALSEEIGEEKHIDTSVINAVSIDGLIGDVYLVTKQNGTPLFGTLKTDPYLSVTPQNNPIYGYATIKGIQYRTRWARLDDESDLGNLILVAAPMTEIRSDLNRFLLLLYVLIPCGLLISGALSWLLIRFAFNPLTHIINTAREISATNLDSSLDLPESRNEVYQLGKVFNEMIDRLKTAFESQKQFVTDASHEIRTPLSIIRSELEFSQRFITESEPLKSIRIALSETDRLAILSEELSLLTRLYATQVRLDSKQIKLDALLDECIQHMKSLAAQKDISLQLHGEKNVIVLGDEEKLKRVVLNLLDNAIKFTRPGGNVSMSSFEEKGRIPPTVGFSVSDSGPGIEATDLPNIFNRFYRSNALRNETPGFGLGLAIVKRLVSLHGGSITVASELGKGAVFTVKLPG